MEIDVPFAVSRRTLQEKPANASQGLNDDLSFDLWIYRFTDVRELQLSFVVCHLLLLNWGLMIVAGDSSAQKAKVKQTWP